MKKFKIFFFVIAMIAISVICYGMFEYKESQVRDMYTQFSDLVPQGWSAFAVEDKPFNSSNGSWSFKGFTPLFNSRYKGFELFTIKPVIDTTNISQSEIRSSYIAFQDAKDNESPDGMTLEHPWFFDVFDVNYNQVPTLSNNLFDLQKTQDYYNGDNSVVGITILTQPNVKGYSANIAYVLHLKPIFYAELFGSILFTLMFIYCLYLLVSQRARLDEKERKRIKHEEELDNTQPLYEILKRKSNPKNFMNPYDSKKVEKANNIYRKLIETDPNDKESLKKLRKEAISELGINFISEDNLKKLKEKVNPSRFMDPYDPQKVEIANALYNRLISTSLDIDEFEQIELESKKLE